MSDLDPDELRQSADDLRGIEAVDAPTCTRLVRIATQLEAAAERIEQLEASLDYHSEAAAIAEQVLEGTRREREYAEEMRNRGMYERHAKLISGGGDTND